MRQSKMSKDLKIMMVVSGMYGLPKTTAMQAQTTYNPHEWDEIYASMWLSHPGQEPAHYADLTAMYFILRQAWRNSEEFEMTIAKRKVKSDEMYRYLNRMIYEGQSVSVQNEIPC